jgi:hypothetical protein
VTLGNMRYFGTTRLEVSATGRIAGIGPRLTVSRYADDVAGGSGARDRGAAISMLGRTGSNTPTTIGAKFRLGGSGAIGKRDNPTPRHRAWRLASRFF